MATIIRDVSEKFQGRAYLVQHLGKFYVASYVAWTFDHKGPETLVFASDSEGNVTDFMDLAGGRGMTPMEAIADLEATLTNEIEA